MGITAEGRGVARKLYVMSPIKVTMKKGRKVAQPTCEPWESGWIVGFVQIATGVGFAVVQTEHGEFETVDIMNLQTETSHA